MATTTRGASRAVVVGLLLLGVGAAVGAGAWAWPRFFPDRLAEGEAAYERGDHEGAAALARDLMRENRGDRRASRLLARATTRLQKDETARGFYRVLPPELFEAEDYFLLATLMRRGGDDGMAKSALEQALERDPEHAEALAVHAELFRGYKMLENAEEEARRASEAPGGRAIGGVQLGLARIGLHDLAGAAEALAAALEADPTLQGAAIGPEEARRLLARALLQQGKGEEAGRVVEAMGEDVPEREALRARALLQQGKAEEAAGALAKAHATMAEEPAAFVGSASCLECHTEIHRAQQASRHGRTFARAPALHEVPLPEGPISDPHSPAVSHTITREDGGMVVRTRVDDRVREAVVRFMMGSGDKGVTLIGREADGTTREIRLSHYPGHGWDRTTGHPEVPASPDGYLGEPMAADSQRRCLTCHTTDFRSAATGEGPAGGDRAIGCERCHGPGGNHLLAVDRGLADPLIGRPRLATAGQTIALCGQCHRPLSDAPPPDDDPNTVRFQASTLVRSACSIQSPGTFDCVTCHDPHHDATPERAFYEQVCLACHSRPEDSLGPVRTGARMPVAAADLLEPSRRVPCPVEPKAGCVECHMPTSKSAMLHSTFTDHYIRVHPRPDPGASKEAAGGSGGPP